MVLYFPVSALVTLFGNVLQNPLDPRARSDAKLMNVVVNFLSMLGVEAETGGVHRMLGVCSEFERIAKVVVEKAEKEHANRRKRKNTEQPAAKTTATGDSPSFNPNPAAAAPTPRPTTAGSATPQASHSMNNQHQPPNNNLSPPPNDHRSPPNTGFGPMNGAASGQGTMSSSSSPGMAPTGWHGDFAAAPPNGGGGVPGGGGDYGGYDMGGFDPMNSVTMGGTGGLTSPPLGGGFFQQPMLPQDLFSLPMTLDWDWAEMSGGAYPSVENGNFGGEVSGRM